MIPVNLTEMTDAQNGLGLRRPIGEYSRHDPAQTRVFPGRPAQVAHARRFVTQMLEGCPITDEAVLCVSELASNALAHTASGKGGVFEVIVCRGETSALVAVYDDGSDTPPAARGLDATSENGRGLGVVALIASRWPTSAAGPAGSSGSRCAGIRRHLTPTLQVSQVPPTLAARMPRADATGAAGGGPSPGPDQYSVDLARHPTDSPRYKENAWMLTAFDFVMTEHVAWRISEHGHRRVFGLPDGSRWLVASRDHQLLSVPADSAKRIVLDVFTVPAGAFSGIPELANALGTLGVVARFRTTDLWDAVGTAIIRQVIRAAQARRLYQGSATPAAIPAFSRTAKNMRFSRMPRPCLTSQLNSSPLSEWPSNAVRCKQRPRPISSTGTVGGGCRQPSW